MRARFRPKPMPTVVGLVLAISLLPANWVAPWSADLAAILWIPLTPAAHVLALVREWLRPELATGALSADAAAELTSQRDQFRGLWHAEQLRADELEARLREVATLTRPPHQVSGLVLAMVVGRGGDSAFTLDAGSMHGVQEGDAVLLRGDELAGRVAGGVRAGSCVLVPLAHKSTGRLDAVVIPARGTGAAGSRASLRVQLTLGDDGLMNGDVDAAAPLAVGDVVRLDDPTWPESARGTRLGEVVWVGRKDEQPLRGSIKVLPTADPTRASRVSIRTTVDARAAAVPEKSP